VVVVALGCVAGVARPVVVSQAAGERLFIVGAAALLALPPPAALFGI
jgi:hypothetical protein